MNEITMPFLTEQELRDFYPEYEDLIQFTMQVQELLDNYRLYYEVAKDQINHLVQER